MNNIKDRNINMNTRVNATVSGIHYLYTLCNPKMLNETQEINYYIQDNYLPN